MSPTVIYSSGSRAGRAQDKGLPQIMIEKEIFVVPSRSTSKCHIISVMWRKLSWYESSDEIRESLIRNVTYREGIYWANQKQNKLVSMSRCRYYCHTIKVKHDVRSCNHII